MAEVEIFPRLHQENEAKLTRGKSKTTLLGTGVRIC